ncbi:hypothetical protein LCGC14_2774420, partial [marine sediment metagenome]
AYLTAKEHLKILFNTNLNSFKGRIYPKSD